MYEPIFTQLPCPVALCTDGSVRIIAGDGDDFYNGQDLSDSLSPSFYIDDELAAGRLEICEEGVWRAVCIDVLDYPDASVACAQLGFSRSGKTTTNANPRKSKGNAEFFTQVPSVVRTLCSRGVPTLEIGYIRGISHVLALRTIWQTVQSLNNSRLTVATH